MKRAHIFGSIYFFAAAHLSASCGGEFESQRESAETRAALPEIGEHAASLRPGQLCTPWRGDERCGDSCADRSLETWDWCDDGACHHKWIECGGVDLEPVARTCAPMSGGESCAAGCEDGTPETYDWCDEGACYHQWVHCGTDVVTPFRPCMTFSSRVACFSGCDDGNVETSDGCYDDVCFHSWMVCDG